MKAFLTMALAAGLSLTATAAMAQDTTTPPTPPTPPGGHMGKAMGPMTKAQHRQHAEEMFKQWDTDGNGTITREEFMAVHDARFDAMDADKDGTVTPEERRAAMQQLMKNKPRGQQPR